jgi:hypothetical protein
MCKHWYFNIEKWRAHRGAKEWFVTLIVWVCNDSNACRQQFWTSRINKYIATAIRLMERNGVIRAWAFTVFKLSLRDGSAKVNVPQSWRFLRVCLIACKVSQKCALASAT